MESGHKHNEELALKSYVDSSFSKIYTGSYTGTAGDTWRQIKSSAELGFTPLMAVIANETDNYVWTTNYNNRACRVGNAVATLITITAIRLDNDGLEVGGNASNHCNLNAKSYTYTVIGQ